MDQSEMSKSQERIDTLRKEIMHGMKSRELRGFDLVEFEEAVREDGGCWLTFSKLPAIDPVAPDDPKVKKAAAAKGKAPVEEAKPTVGKVWVSFSDLQQPGATSTTQRVSLETCPPAVKETVDGNEVWVDQEESDKLFETARTYIHLRLDLTVPVTQHIPDQPEPTPQEIVPVKTFIKWPYSKIATDDFRKQCAIAIKALTREYYNMFHGDLEKQFGQTLSHQESQAKYEERKKEFLYDINQSGKYHILKEKMKKTVVRIVREHFGKTESFKGLKKDERDHFYSELYVFLVQEMRRTV